MTDRESALPVSARAWIYPTAIHGILGLMVLTRLLVAQPRYQRIFQEFNLLLPHATEAFLSLGEWVQSEGVFCIALAALLLVVDAVVLWLLGGWERCEGQAWFFGVLILLVGTWLVMEVSFFLPYLKLQEALSR
jgi:type II secretory pathway component PulF